MADWVRITAEWAEPIYKLMLAELLRGQYLQCDETPVKFIDPDEKGHRAEQGYLWVVSAPGGDVVFDWRLTRRHGELTTLLTDNYVGLVQSDGYEAYDAYAAKRPGVLRVGCWAHARRKFFEAQKHSPRVANAALRMAAESGHATLSLGGKNSSLPFTHSVALTHCASSRISGAPSVLLSFIAAVSESDFFNYSKSTVTTCDD